MVPSNSFDEAIGLDLMKTLKTLPMSLDILRETRIGRSVGIFRKACKTKEAAAMGRTLIKSWQHLLPENDVPETNKDEANKGEVNVNIQPIVQNIHSKKSDEVEPISRENDNVTMDTIEIHESSSETNDIYVYVKGTHVDITRITPAGVLKDIQVLLQRRPEIKISNRSLRITCLKNHERELMIDTQFIAGHQVTCTEPYEKSRNHVNRTNCGIIFDVDVEVTIDEIEQELGVKAKRNTRRVKGVFIFRWWNARICLYRMEAISSSLVYPRTHTVLSLPGLRPQSNQMQFQTKMSHMLEESFIWSLSE